MKNNDKNTVINENEMENVNGGMLSYELLLAMHHMRSKDSADKQND